MLDIPLTRLKTDAVLLTPLYSHEVISGCKPARVNMLTVQGLCLVVSFFAALYSFKRQIERLYDYLIVGTAKYKSASRCTPS